MEWDSVFGDEFAAVAIIDRLLHFSTTVNIRGESHRLKDKKRAGIFMVPPDMAGDSEPQVGNVRPAESGEFHSGLDNPQEPSIVLVAGRPDYF